MISILAAVFSLSIAHAADVNWTDTSPEQMASMKQSMAMALQNANLTCFGKETAPNGHVSEGEYALSDIAAKIQDADLVNLNTAGTEPFLLFMGTVGDKIERMNTNVTVSVSADKKTVTHLEFEQHHFETVTDTENVGTIDQPNYQVVSKLVDTSIVGSCTVMQ